MAVSFEEAFEIAQEKYPHKINHYEEYEKYFVFENDDHPLGIGGDYTPVVIWKSDGEILHYVPIFFNLDGSAEDVGDVISEGEI